MKGAKVCVPFAIKSRSTKLSCHATECQEQSNKLGEGLNCSYF